MEIEANKKYQRTEASSLEKPRISTMVKISEVSGAIDSASGPVSKSILN